MCRGLGSRRRTLSKVVLKELSEGLNRIPRDVEHSIVPCAKVVAHDIPICDVYPTHKGGVLVYDDHFTVVTAVVKCVNNTQLYAI